MHRLFAQRKFVVLVLFVLTASEVVDGQSGSTSFHGAPLAIPGTIQVEDFDNGGEGVAYHDATSGNSGGAYRTTDVDISATGDGGGGFNIGSIDAGEWLLYTINVNIPDTYTLEVRVASEAAGGTFHIEVDGIDKTGAISVPSTGSSSNWLTITKSGISLSSGQYLKLVVDSVNSQTGTFGSINYITLRRESRVSYVYDELGRLVGVSDSIGDAVSYAYDAVGNVLSIGRQTSTQVSIVEFAPNNGAVGAAVRIYGTGFSTQPTQNTVQFNGTAATVIASSSTRIDASIPAGATSGPISITTPTGSATSAGAFVVSPNPTTPSITSFNPVVATPGTAITISGAGFDTNIQNNKVAFSVTRGNVATASASIITVPVPGGVPAGRITVTTPAGSALSAADLFVPPSPYAASDVLVTARATFGVAQPVAITSSGKIGLVIFDAIAGRRISLVQSGFSCTTNVTKVLHPSGPTMWTDCGATFMEPQIVSATATHTILVDPSGSTTGTHTVTVYDVPPDVVGTIAPNGVSQTVTTTTPGQKARLTFAGTAGQRVSIKFTSNTFSPNGCAASIRIIKPDQTVLASKDACPVAFMEPQTLATSGTYAVEVDPYQRSTGSIALTLYDVPADVTGAVVINGSALSISLPTPGQKATVTFDGTAGQQVTVRVTANTICSSSVRLYRQDGVTQLGVDFPCQSSSNMSPVTLPASETYIIKVDPEEAKTGSLSLRVTSP